MTEPIRRPGSPWRLLVHEYAGEQPDGTLYSTSHTVSNDPEAAKSRGPLQHVYLLPPTTEFDELVVGRWLHVEQMDEALWWLDIGGLVVHVVAGDDGKPVSVWWDLDDRRDGVTYEDRT